MEHWSPLKFSPRHKGKTLPQIVFSDPDWFFWAIEKGNVFRDNLVGQATDIDRKARSIRIPNNDDGALRVEYLVHPNGGVFSEMRVISANHPLDVGGSRAIRRPVIDMSTPRSLKDYDKSGYRLFLMFLKRIVFGNSHIVMTKKRCEEFFDNPANFDR